MIQLKPLAKRTHVKVFVETTNAIGDTQYYISATGFSPIYIWVRTGQELVEIKRYAEVFAEKFNDMCSILSL